MVDLTIDRTVRISEDAVFRELDGEAVILHLGSGREDLTTNPR